MVDDKAKTILTEYAEAVLQRYKEKLISENVVASGEILNMTAETEIQYTDEGAQYSISFNNDTYQYIEEGRQPGAFPPVDAIKKWIETKPVIPQPFQLPSGKMTTPTNDQLAFLIGRKIRDKGIQARPYLQEILDELREEYMEKLQQAIKDDAYEEFEQELLKP